jgi:hypothetical protein
MCCGAGGAVRTAVKEVSIDFTREKLTNIRNAGADIIVDACPFCHLQLDLGQMEANNIYKTMIGEILVSRYQINKKLATGGFGSTYIAKDLQNNQECVVKKLQPITTEQKFLEQARRLFKKEAETLKKLNHN